MAMSRANEHHDQKCDLCNHAGKLEVFGRSRHARYSWDYCEHCPRDSFCRCSRDHGYDRHAKRNEPNKKRDDSKPHENDKSFKPCHIHRDHCKHSYEECHKNPKNNKHVSHHFESHHSSDSDSSSMTTTHSTKSSVNESKSSRESSKKDEIFTWTR